jgi:hypothetical protein
MQHGSGCGIVGREGRAQQTRNVRQMWETRVGNLP